MSLSLHELHSPLSWALTLIVIHNSTMYYLTRIRDRTSDGSDYHYAVICPTADAAQYVCDNVQRLVPPLGPDSDDWVQWPKCKASADEYYCTIDEAVEAAWHGANESPQLHPDLPLSLVNYDCITHCPDFLVDDVAWQQYCDEYVQ